MNTLDPIHVAVLIHSLVQRAISENTLDGGHLKPLAGAGLVSRLFQQLRDTQHGHPFFILLENEVHNGSFLLVNHENAINHLVPVRAATAAVPSAGSLDGATLAGTQSDVLSLLLRYELFQSTRPLRGATIRVRLFSAGVGISTHAPLAERDDSPSWLLLLPLQKPYLLFRFIR